MKKACSMLLAAAMTLSLAVPALAADTLTTTYDADKTFEDGSGEFSTTLEGTIKATHLVVTVPATVPFQVDPTKDGATDPTAQVTQPESITITNSSVVPVYVSINKVAADGVTLVTDAEELKKTPDVGNDPNLMFSIDKTGTVKSYETVAHWLTEETVNYTLADKGKIEAAKMDEGEAKPGTMDLTLYARADRGWAAEDKFTITPTFVVSVVEPASAGPAALDPMVQLEDGESTPVAGVPVQTPVDGADGE